MKFMLDHNLPPGLARALNELSKSEGHEVYPLREKFAEDVKDHAWISALGRESEWAVISGDISIFKVEEARVAWREAKLTIFFLAPGWAHLTFWIKAAKLVQMWPTILALATSQRPGVLYRVRLTGKPEVLSPPG